MNFCISAYFLSQPSCEDQDFIILNVHLLICSLCSSFMFPLCKTVGVLHCAMCGNDVFTLVQQKSRLQISNCLWLLITVTCADFPASSSPNVIIFLLSFLFSLAFLQFFILCSPSLLLLPHQLDCITLSSYSLFVIFIITIQFPIHSSSSGSSMYFSNLCYNHCFASVHDFFPSQITILIFCGIHLSTVTHENKKKFPLQLLFQQFS